MEVEIKNLKRGQIVYDITDYYKVYSDPEFVNGKWQVDTTASSDHAHILYEGHELFDNADLS